MSDTAYAGAWEPGAVGLFAFYLFLLAVIKHSLYM